MQKVEHFDVFIVALLCNQIAAHLESGGIKQEYEADVRNYLNPLHAETHSV